MAIAGKGFQSTRLHTAGYSVTSTTAGTAIDLIVTGQVRNLIPVGIVFWSTGDYDVTFANGNTDTITVTGPMFFPCGGITQIDATTASGLKLSALYHE